MKLYHGSPAENFRPTYGLGRDDHDYGRGFYMTADIDLAREWAAGQRVDTVGWLHVYEVDVTSLNTFDFADAGIYAWLAELMKHRQADTSPSYVRSVEKFISKYGVDVSGYDIIKGWRADASYFFIAQQFVRNQIDVSILEELLRLGDLGVQYFIKSERAFAALRELDDEKELVDGSVYRARYDARDELARKNMTELIYDPVRNPLARTFADLMKEVP